MLFDKIIKDDGISLGYLSDFLSKKEADSYFEQMLKEAAWDRPIISVNGKSYTTPRSVAWHADDGCTYRYSGQTHQAAPWTRNMIKLRTKVEAFSSHYFNGVLLNKYEDGNEYVSPHADDEPEMGSDCIAAISLGATRDFVVSHNVNKCRYVIPLEHGSILLMMGKTQHVSKHGIPKRKNVKDPRISLTFRKRIV